MKASLKLIYPLRSATKYALLKHPNWHEYSLECSSEQKTHRLCLHLERSPATLEWIFQAPVSLETIGQVALAFEKDLFAMLESAELMPKEPYIHAFHT